MPAIRYLDRTLLRVEDNLALDEALLLEAESGAGTEVLRLWEWPALAVVLGAGGRLAEEVNEAACALDGVPVLRRSSGGGTVLLGRGCLVFSLVLRLDRNQALAEIQSSYAWILGRMARALELPGVQPAGTSDLALAGRKFSGNSQQRKRDHLLHHGTLLYAFSLSSIGRYLPPPPRQPEYRAGRPHDGFLCNLPLTAEVLKERLRREWGPDEPLAYLPQAEVNTLVAQKYSTAAWVRRR
jgi:lipoate-protein ligase A